MEAAEAEFLGQVLREGRAEGGQPPGQEGTLPPLPASALELPQQLVARKQTQHSPGMLWEVSQDDSDTTVLLKERRVLKLQMVTF